MNKRHLSFGRSYPAPKCPSNAVTYWWRISPYFLLRKPKGPKNTILTPLITIVQACDLGSVNQVLPPGSLNLGNDAKTKGKLRIYSQ